MHGADTPPEEGQYTPHQTYIQAHQDQTNEGHSQGTWIQIKSPVHSWKLALFFVLQSPIRTILLKHFQHTVESWHCFLYYNPRLELFCWNTSSTQLKVDIVFCTTIPDHNYRKILKISQGAYIFQRPFLRGLVLEGLMYWGKIAFRNWLG